MTPKPNLDDAAKYGYEDPDAVNKYGYEDPDAANKYGYEDPDAAAPQQTNHGDSGGFLRRQPRRSSMKSGDSTQRRRASIQTVGTIEVYLPGRSGPIKRRTSIDFSETCTFQPPPPNTDPNDMSDRWMTTEEYEKIEKDNNKIVRAIGKGTDKNFCTRGLENRFVAEADRPRQESHQAVWEEQLRQKEDGTFDESRLSEKYHLTAIQSKIQAVERAEQDNADIESYLKSTRRMMRRVSC